MDIAQVGIDALHFFAVEHGLQAEHTVGGWVLRADVHHVFVVGKELVLLGLQLTVFGEREFVAVVGLVVVLQCIFIVELPVFSEGVSLEIAAQEQAAHIGVAEEFYSIEVIDFAFQQISACPDVDD